MLGLRDVFVVSPTSFHHHLHHRSAEAINPADPPGHLSNPATALGVGVGVNVIPLLTATPRLTPQSGMGLSDESDNSMYNAGGSHNQGSVVGGGSSGIQLWQNPHQHHLLQHLQQQPNQLPLAHHHIPPSYFKKPSAVPTTALLDRNGNSGSTSLVHVGGSGDAVSRVVATATISNCSGTATCQDCGNQAKKDCSYRRCRTCCKSRGFNCATHVKSSWVPAARRRDRQLMAATVSAGCGGTTAGSSGSTSGAKKPRLVASHTTTTSHTSTSNTTPPQSFDTSSSSQDACFRETLPGQVRAPAFFKCVKVTAVEDGVDKYAYQAMVKIGGHVFKGFLFDQGAEGREGFPILSELQLGGGSSGGARNDNGASTSSPNLLDTVDAYGAASGGELLGIGGGLSYSNPLN